MEPAIRVVQLSDLHFSSAPGGYMLRDTAETFDAVAQQVIQEAPDLVIVTGDIANEGHPEEYEMAGRALSDLGLPVYCLPGNHDRADALNAHLPRPGIALQRSLSVGGWLFLFGDSNDGGVRYDDAHGWMDLEDRVHEAKGAMTSHECSWLSRQLAARADTPAMLWIHHPPGGSGMFERPQYDEQVAGLVAAAGNLRAVSAGHAHTGIIGEVGGLPSYFCPSTGVSVDFEALTLLPPGYRRFTFAADGELTTELVWLSDERWAERVQLPDWAAQYLAGQMSDDELNARIAESSGGQ